MTRDLVQATTTNFIDLPYTPTLRLAGCVGFVLVRLSALVFTDREQTMVGLEVMRSLLVLVQRVA